MIRGVHKCYLCRNSSHVLILPLDSTVVTRILVFQTRKSLHVTQLKIQNDRYSLSAFLTQNIECLFSVHIANLSLTDEKFESCIQNKWYKPHNQVKIFFRNMFV